MYSIYFTLLYKNTIKYNLYPCRFIFLYMLPYKKTVQLVQFYVIMAILLCNIYFVEKKKILNKSFNIKGYAFIKQTQ